MIEFFKEGDMVLVVYVGFVFIILLLINDVSMLVNFILSLSFDIMLSKGLNVIDGLEKVNELFK